MTNTQEELKQLVEHAINDFNDHDTYLISRDLSERCICSKFAMYLEKFVSDSRFRDYHVDVEYNRGAKGNEYRPKNIGDKRIVVDLIVHKRGYNPELGFNNLICIEMKKSNDKRGFSQDEERLKLMTISSSTFCYRMGFLIVADMKKHKLKIQEKFHTDYDF